MILRVISKLNDSEILPFYDSTSKKNIRKQISKDWKFGEG